MTTKKVKAPKFRVRRTPRSATPAPEVQEGEVLPSDGAAAEAADKPFDTDAGSDGFGDAPYPGSAAADALKAKNNGSGTTESEPEDEDEINAEIDAIRREGLTGRQLRLARRIAQMHDIVATSDFDAVRLLRRAGIDPFKQGAVLDMIAADDAESGSREVATTSADKVPGPVTGASPLLSDDVLERLSNEDEIWKIQRDIANRRKRKLLLLAVRLFVFIGIPTLVSGIYFYNIAAPMYGTKSAFVIQQAEAPSATMSGLGGIISGSPLATSQDSITVQDYLTSRDAMLRLDADAGFREHFSSEAIDPIQRLPENPTNEETYKVYKKRVTVGYDPTEGLLRLEVVAGDPETSQEFSDLLVAYAEEQVDDLTQRLREDQMKGARESLEDAEDKMIAAQERVILLQEQLGIFSADAETSSIMSQISGFESQLQNKKLALQQLLDNENPNQARVDGTRGDIRRLESLITDLRSSLTEANNGSASLARITAELRMAEGELTTRQLMAQQALQALEAARIEANRQVRYLSLSSRPVAPDEPTYPRKFENTLLAMLIFSGIYLMAALTAAVLREQVSA
ncbi:capsule biosynthesis protein [Celeribacter litoreus]|uniref:capsule biosynthesis protein n=1 Tax=Celeribacter litoreus TaxID=2876714 RepID=UPI001CCB5E66|nr:capsule biosynthesis protein [Celeribacter litoreus]MCA0042578.1 capsule biosynthesis protein [Celeribacter litoreus]